MGTVYKTQLVTMETEAARLAAMLVTKDSIAQHLVVMENSEETVYTNAVRTVWTMKYVTEWTDTVSPVSLGLRD